MGKKQWIAAVSTVVAVQVVIACGTDSAQNASKVAALGSGRGAPFSLSMADLTSPQASWLIGNWTSDTRSHGDYRQIRLSGDPGRAMVYEWYNADVGSDSNPALPPSPTYCSYRFTSSGFQLQLTAPPVVQPVDGILTAHIGGIELIDEASQDDPGCQMFLVDARKHAATSVFSFGFYRDRDGNLFQDGWTLKRTNP